MKKPSTTPARAAARRISSAYQVCVDLIDREFPLSEWNLYVFQFSDGDNWGEDNQISLKLLGERILPQVNLFCYGQVESPYGSGEFLRTLRDGTRQGRREPGALGNPRPRRHLRLDQAVSGQRKVKSWPLAASNRCRPIWLRSKPRWNSTPATTASISTRPSSSWSTTTSSNEIAAYGGFPTRYPHWRFGMEYEQLSKGYSYGLQKIYEMVINNDPCYAYLMRSNGLTDQKMVMAHVYGHCDFFKNNYWFSKTDRKMMDEMANHGNRIRRYMDRFGVEEVETFIDACLSIEDLIDVHSPFIKRFDRPIACAGRPCRRTRSRCGPASSKPRTTWTSSSTRPMRWRQRRERPARTAGVRPALSQGAVAGRDAVPSGARPAEALAARRAVDRAGRSLLLRSAGADQDHERGLGQLLAFDHHDPPGADAGRRGQLLRPSLRHDGHFARPLESVQARHRAVPRHRRPLEQGTVRQGVRRVRRSGRQATTGTPTAGLGREKIFEVRRIHNDLTFIDTFLTLEFCREHKLFSFGYNDDTNYYEIESREFPKIKQRLLFSLTHRGQPFITVREGNYKNRGELFLEHEFNGVELQMAYARDTLTNLQRLWGRPVHIETVLGDVKTILSYDGLEHSAEQFKPSTR